MNFNKFLRTIQTIPTGTKLYTLNQRKPFSFNGFANNYVYIVNSKGNQRPMRIIEFETMWKNRIGKDIHSWYGNHKSETTAFRNTSYVRALVVKILTDSKDKNTT